MNSTPKTNKAKNKKATVVKKDVTVVFSEGSKSKDKNRHYTNEELNEKMYYFYNHGGPIMDI